MRDRSHGNGVVIREIGSGSFMVDIQRDKKRARKVYKTLAEAKTAASQNAIAIRNEGSSVLDLSPEQRHDAVTAIRLAEGAASLTDAVQANARLPASQKPILSHGWTATC